MSICPKCGQFSVYSNDIEAIANAELLVKTENRIQQCCQNCGWMAFQQNQV